MTCNTYIQFFKTIAEPSRVEILFSLKEKDMVVSDLIEKLGKEQSAVSHNLRILKERGFVNSEANGKSRKYSLTKEAKIMIDEMDQHVKKYFHKDCRCGK